MPRDRLAKLFDASDDAMAERAAQIARLRAHTRLLRDYFEALNGLASSDAPEEAGTHAESLASSISDIGNAIRGSSQPFSSDVVRTASERVFGAIQLSALRDEISARYETIDKELATQQAALDFVAAALVNSTRVELAGRYDRKVRGIYVSSGEIRKPGTWKSSRAMLLRRQALVPEIDRARSANTKLREAWTSAADGKLSHEDLVSTLSDLRKLVAVIDALDSESEPEGGS